VTVEATGFQRKQVTNVNVRVTETSVVNAQLAVVGATEQITVSGSDTQPVQTTSGTLGGTLTQQVVVALPLATRNIIDLLGTDAGVASVLSSPSPTGQGSNSLFVAGSRATVNNYVINGVDANNFEFHTLAPGIVPTPSPDSVQEFKTQTSLYDATMGRGSGGNITLVTRSGTSKIHGGGYEFHRDRALSANDFFFNKAGAPKPALIQNIFGGSLGGPLPKSVFWFGNYEGARQKNGVSGSITGPLAVLPATRDAASLAQAFGVPADKIDPVALKFLNAPGPYNGYLFASGTGAAPGKLGSFAFSSPVVFNSNQFTSRLDKDWNIGGGPNRISGVYFWSRGRLVNPGGASTISLGQPYSFDFGNDTFSLSDTHTFSSNMLNEATFGFTWNKRDINNIGGVDINSLGLSRFNQSILQGTPTLSFAEQLPCCAAAASTDQTQHNASFTVRDLVTYSTGSHSFRFGFEHRRYQFNYNGTTLGQRGTIGFSTGIANTLYGRPAGIDNLSIRDFLIGAPSFTSIGSGLRNVGFRAHDFVGFAQDDYRVTRRLTLNLGVRYDFMANNTEVHNHIGNFDPSLVPTDARSIGGPGLLQGFIAPEDLPGFGTPGVSPSTLKGEDKNNFAPRVSFAYDVRGDGKFAVRGGYGIYYVRISAGAVLQTISQVPFALNASLVNTAGAAGLLKDPFPKLPLPSDFPLQPTPATLTGINPTTGAPIFNGLLLSVSALDRNVRTPYNEQWNLTTQYEFLPGWVAEVGYLGTHGVKLLKNTSVNNALLRNANNPAAFGIITNSSANRDARASIVGLSATGLNMYSNGGNSVYHALLTTVSHRFSRNLFFKGAYTFAKSIDDFPASAGGDFGAGSSFGNQFIPALNRGLSAFDVRHRLTITYVYQLPGPSIGLLGTLLGRWTINGLTTYQSGFPGAVFQSIGSSSLSGTAGFGNVLANCQLTTGGGVTAHLDNYLNAACVQTTALLTGGTVFGPLSPVEGRGDQTYTIDSRGSGRLQGTSSRGVFRNPFQQRWDFSLAKKMTVRKLGEGGEVEFRAEFFKLFNTPIFNGPSSTAGTTSFGRITSTIDNSGRQIQFALKVNF
jgi:outer membrane receptor protein involved in Fe transport